MNPKLTESGWKTLASKFKIKDNGLQRALADYAKIDDKKHDELLEAIESVKELARNLKKAKDVADLAPVVKYLTDMLGAVQTEQRDLAKAKAETQKAEAAKKKPEEDDEGEEEQGAYEDKLRAVFQKLKGAKDVAYQFIVCDAKPHCAVMVAKRITSQHKEELTKITGGSKRFLKIGTRTFQDGRFSLTTEDQMSGLAKKLQDSIKTYTGKKLPIRVGTETAEEDDAKAAAPSAPSAQAPGAAAKGPSPAQQAAQQRKALEERRNAFKKARATWLAVKDKAEADLEKVKDGARMEYMADAEQYPKIVKGCKDIDAILDHLDDELRDTLDQYASTPLTNQAKLHALSATASKVLDRYYSYVAADPIMKAIDKKEFADVTVHAPILKALGDLRKSLS